MSNGDEVSPAAVTFLVWLTSHNNSIRHSPYRFTIVMSQPPLVTPGDDIAITRDLYEDGILANLTGATIYAALQNARGRQYIASTLQSSSASGAAWATGRVVVEFTAAQSIALRRGDAWLEIEVIRGGKKKTWPLFHIEVQQGSI